MTVSSHPSRRRVLQGAASILAAPVVAVLPVRAPLAQDAALPVDIIQAWRELGQLTTQAIELGVPAPRMSAQVDADEERDYLQLMPATVELIESLERAGPEQTAPRIGIEDLLKRADELLRRVHQAERNLPDDRAEGMSLQTLPARPAFGDIKDGYRKLFESCAVRDDYRSTVNWYLSKILHEDHQKSWYEVAKEVCCPWYFVAIIHAMEAAFNFRSHLHNGDPLERRTVQVPRGRPKVWNPPNDWQTSAVDALRFDGFQDLSDWGLERTLYRWEAYNGFRSRRNGINTPYLWSFSNHYAKGKFVADNVWDPSAVSKQCGAAVMLKELVDRRIVEIPG
jgi:lysozyme family protein